MEIDTEVDVQRHEHVEDRRVVVADRLKMESGPVQNVDLPEMFVLPIVSPCCKGQRGRTPLALCLFFWEPLDLFLLSFRTRTSQGIVT